MKTEKSKNTKLLLIINVYFVFLFSMIRDVQSVCFCMCHFDMVPLNLTSLYRLQRIFFEHLVNLHRYKVKCMQYA